MNQNIDELIKEAIESGNTGRKVILNWNCRCGVQVTGEICPHCGNSISNLLNAGEQAVDNNITYNRQKPAISFEKGTNGNLFSASFQPRTTTATNIQVSNYNVTWKCEFCRGKNKVTDKVCKFCKAPKNPNTTFDRELQSQNVINTPSPTDYTNKQNYISDEVAKAVAAKRARKTTAVAVFLTIILCIIFMALLLK